MLVVESYLRYRNSVGCSQFVAAPYEMELNLISILICTKDQRLGYRGYIEGAVGGRLNLEIIQSATSAALLSIFFITFASKSAHKKLAHAFKVKNAILRDFFISTINSGFY